MDRLSEYLPATPDDSRYSPQLLQAAGILDVTAIYNRHGTAEDAHASTELIEPDSVVYIEATGAPATTFPLTAYKRLYGKDEAYQAKKNDFLQTLHEDEGSPIENARAFPAHSNALYRDLVEKDCDIINADLGTWTGPLHDSTLRSFQSNSLDIVYNTKPHTGIARDLQAMAQLTAENAYGHQVREHVACNVIAVDAARLYRNPRLAANTTHTPEGRVNAYLIYGTAHARSLTSKLTQAGIQTAPVEIKTLHEHQYIDTTTKQFEANRKRRIAQTAFLATETCLMENYDEACNVFAHMYPQLEHLNDNRDEAIDFCIRSIKIWQYYLSDYDRALAERESLIRQYLA